MDITEAKKLAKDAGLELKRACGTARKNPVYILCRGRDFANTIFPAPFSAVDPESFKLEISRMLRREKMA